jgi:molecular chaperone GrpE
MSDEHTPHEEEETLETEAQEPEGAVSEDAGELTIDPLVEEMRDRLMRALADAENTRRRAERDKEDALKYAITRFARDILSVSDNLRRALDSVDDAAKAEGGEALAALLSGVSMTERELMNVFSQHGIKQVNPKAGDRFDPNVHQAIAEVPGTGQPNGSVVQVTQTGFTIGGRLLRPAMVLVAKDASGKGGAQAPASDAEA